jgi:hypothetical protein
MRTGADADALALLSEKIENELQAVNKKREWNESYLIKLLEHLSTLENFTTHKESVDPIKKKLHVLILDTLNYFMTDDPGEAGKKFFQLLTKPAYEKKLKEVLLTSPAHLHLVRSVINNYGYFCCEVKENNIPKAVEYYTLAVDLNHSIAYFNLARHQAKNPLTIAASIDTFKKAYKTTAVTSGFTFNFDGKSLDFHTTLLQQLTTIAKSQTTAEEKKVSLHAFTTLQELYFTRWSNPENLEQLQEMSNFLDELEMAIAENTEGESKENLKKLRAVLYEKIMPCFEPVFDNTHIPYGPAGKVFYSLLSNIGLKDLFTSTATTRLQNNVGRCIHKTVSSIPLKDNEIKAWKMALELTPTLIDIDVNAMWKFLVKTNSFPDEKTMKQTAQFFNHLFLAMKRKPFAFPSECQYFSRRLTEITAHINSKNELAWEAAFEANLALNILVSLSSVTADDAIDFIDRSTAMFKSLTPERIKNKHEEITKIIEQFERISKNFEATTHENLKQRISHFYDLIQYNLIDDSYKIDAVNKPNKIFECRFQAVKFSPLHHNTWNLALSYLKGEGIEKNLKEAVNLLLFSISLAKNDSDIIGVINKLKEIAEKDTAALAVLKAPYAEGAQLLARVWEEKNPNLALEHYDQALTLSIERKNAPQQTAVLTQLLAWHKHLGDNAFNRTIEATLERFFGTPTSPGIKDKEALGLITNHFHTTHQYDLAAKYSLLHLETISFDLSSNDKEQQRAILRQKIKILEKLKDKSGKWLTTDPALTKALKGTVYDLEVQRLMIAENAQIGIEFFLVAMANIKKREQEGNLDPSTSRDQLLKKGIDNWVNAINQSLNDGTQKIPPSIFTKLIEFCLQDADPYLLALATEARNKLVETLKGNRFYDANILEIKFYEEEVQSYEKIIETEQKLAADNDRPEDHVWTAKKRQQAEKSKEQYIRALGSALEFLFQMSKTQIIQFKNAGYPSPDKLKKEYLAKLNNLAVNANIKNQTLIEAISTREDLTDIISLSSFRRSKKQDKTLQDLNKKDHPLALYHSRSKDPLTNVVRSLRFIALASSDIHAVSEQFQLSEAEIGAYILKERNFLGEWIRDKKPDHELVAKTLAIINDSSFATFVAMARGSNITMGSLLQAMVESKHGVAAAKPLAKALAPLMEKNAVFGPLPVFFALLNEIERKLDAMIRETTRTNLNIAEIEKMKKTIDHANTCLEKLNKFFPKSHVGVFTLAKSKITQNEEKISQARKTLDSLLIPKSSLIAKTVPSPTFVTPPVSFKQPIIASAPELEFRLLDMSVDGIYNAAYRQSLLENPSEYRPEDIEYVRKIHERSLSEAAQRATRVASIVTPAVEVVPTPAAAITSTPPTAEVTPTPAAAIAPTPAAEVTSSSKSTTKTKTQQQPALAKEKSTLFTATTTPPISEKTLKRSKKKIILNGGP